MATATEKFAAETFAGNWERRQCFVWLEQPEHAEDYVEPGIESGARAGEEKTRSAR